MAASHKLYAEASNNKVNCPADFMANGGSMRNSYAFYMNDLPYELFKLISEGAQGVVK